MEKILEQFQKDKIVPVVVIEDASKAQPLAKALLDGGLSCAEVTFRTAAAADAIREMTDAYPEMVVGAGTVLTVEQVDQAVAAGAKFIVSPGFDEEIVDYCLERRIPVLPGCVTASEVAKAVKHGLRTIKFFPAQQAGGIAVIQALSAPYPMVQFMPTGGISQQNMESYLSKKCVLCCGGSWMVKKDLIEQEKFDTIRQMTEEAVELAKNIKKL